MLKQFYSQKKRRCRHLFRERRHIELSVFYEKHLLIQNRSMCNCIIRWRKDEIKCSNTYTN